MLNKWNITCRYGLSAILFQMSHQQAFVQFHIDFMSLLLALCFIYLIRLHIYNIFATFCVGTQVVICGMALSLDIICTILVAI